MTEGSGFWNGTTLGDAAGTHYRAPYNAQEFGLFWHHVLGSTYDAGVIPSYLNNLEVTAPGGVMSVQVAPGGAFVGGHVYESDAVETLVIAGNSSGNPRIDRVVLRVSYAAQEVRLAVLQGTAAANPVPPSLTRVYATTWEMSLARVWVPDSVATIEPDYVIDEREFLYNYHEALSGGLFDNLVYNSEFMGFSEVAAGPAANIAPDMWQTVYDTYSIVDDDTRPAQMARGRAIKITADSANAGIEQYIPVAGGEIYTVKVLCKAAAGSEAKVAIRNRTTNIATAVSREQGYNVVMLRFTGPPVDYTYVQLLAGNSTDVVWFGQCIVTKGFVPGPFRPIREIVMFDKNVDYQLLNRSDSTGTWNMTTIFNVPDGARGAYFMMDFNDSGSAAAAATAAYGQIGKDPGAIKNRVPGLRDNYIRSVAGWTQVDENNDVYYRIDASGVNTADMTVHLQGIAI